MAEYLRRLLAGLLAALMISCLCACAPRDRAAGAADWAADFDVDTDLPISAQFASLAEFAVADGRVEGVQFALVENGRLLAVSAIGLADRERQTPMTPDTLINVASISKAVTAWGVMALAETSGLDLDAPVRQWLGNDDLYDELFPAVDVSIRMLLSHTSGLSGQSVPVTPATEPLPSLTDILRGDSSVPKPRLSGRPGGDFSYSGAGYLLLQKLIEHHTQQAFAEFMAETVLVPANMSRSTFEIAPRMLEELAVYYRGDGRRREPYHLPGAAGGLYSTAADMARFMMLYTETGSAARRRILPDEAFHSLLDPGPRVGDVRYALGHYTYDTVEGVRVAFHAGGNPGLRAFFMVAADRGIGFFAVANSDDGAVLHAGLMRLWGDHYGLTLHPDIP